MAHDGIFYGTEQANGVYTEVFVEALVLSIDEGFEEIGTDFLIGHGAAVLIEELAYENTISRLRSEIESRDAEIRDLRSMIEDKNEIISLLKRNSSL